MRRISWFVVISVAAGTLAAQAPAERADNTDAHPQLVRSTAIQPGDSPLVRAAKHALAARQGGKNRLTIDRRALHGTGRVSQATGSANISFNLPPADARSNDPASPSQADAARAAQADITAKIQALKTEQQRMAAEAEEPYGGNDVDENRVEQRQSQIPNEIEQAQRQLTPPPPPPQ